MISLRTTASGPHVNFVRRCQPKSRCESGHL